MWKHKTKWLVRGGRKVRCYLCGKKILAKGDLFLFHEDTGYYSHHSCQAESATISGNERRRAVKKIAVGAAVVGAIAAGAGKFLDVSSQSKNSPAAQTILTSQGLIPPALTSDPANPVPGQMWYRSDAGVEAHFDGVQNRVVYSSEINDGNVHVTSKGIVNGLSVLPNDGTGWFGPDTTKGATSRGQYGSPYTETTGIQDAIEWQKSNPGNKIMLFAGTYNCTVGLTVYSETVIESEYAHTMYNTYDSPHGLITYGAVININASSTDGISGSGDNSIGPKIKNIIVNFTTSTTGHGISLVKSDTSTQDPSFYMTELDDVFVIGNDINHYGFFFDSISNMKFGKIGIIGGGGIHYGNSTTQNIGTGTIDYIYHFATSTGTTSLTNYNEFTSTNSSGEHLNSINLLHINYLKILVTSGVAMTNAIYLNYVSTSVFGLIDLETVTIVTNNINLANSYYNVFQNIAGNTSESPITSDSSSSYNTVVNISVDGYPTWNTNNLTISFGSSGYLYGSTSNNPIGIAPNGTIFAKGTIRAQDAFLVYGGINRANAPQPSLSTNPPVSGTVYQNSNTYDIRLKIPVTYSPTSSAAATLATGTSSSSTVTTSTKVSIPAGVTAGEILTYDMVVPAGWYFELVVTNATIGTAEVQAA